MAEPMGVVLAGIGGYGLVYVNEMLEKAGAKGAVLKGAVDPHPESCPRIGELEAAGVPVFDSLEAFYREHTADLAVISAPIQFHVEATCLALSHGSHVLCEKPAAAMLEDVQRMRKARDDSGRVVAIGYQWSFSEAVLQAKRDILSGRFGRPIRCKTIVLWPRGWNYYARGWAGKMRDAEGRWVLDSVAANATAHYLHNMLFLLGDEMALSAWPKRIEAEVYRANAIENYDTAAFRIHVGGVVPLLFLVSHAITTEAIRQPEFVLEFEHASLRYFAQSGEGTGHIRAFLRTGEVVDYGNPSADDGRKLWMTLEAIRNGSGISCGLEAAAAHTACMGAVHDLFPEVPDFPEEWIVRDSVKGMTYVKGLAGQMNLCYVKWRLPSEVGAPWARHAVARSIRNWL